jgi:hypothetical protein
MAGPDFKNSPEKWAITTSLLNMIWRDLFGRMVPILWAGGPLPFTVDQYLKKLLVFRKNQEPNFPAYFGLSRRFLLLYIDLMHSKGAIKTKHEMEKRLRDIHKEFVKEAGHPPLPGGKKYFSTTCRMKQQFYGIETTGRFEGRLDVIRNYLENGAEIKSGKTTFTVEPMPIRFFRANDVFDFVMGDTGLDLFHPTSPFDDVQGGTPDERLANIYRAYTYRETGRRPVNLPISGKRKSGFPRERPAIHLSIPGGPSNIELADGAALMWWIVQGFDVKTQDAVTKWLGDLVQPGVDVDAFITWLRPNREWQMKGAIYREIMAELPKVQATIWLEGAQSSYGKAYFDNSDTGLRQVFERRVELGLPPSKVMIFRGIDKKVRWSWVDEQVRDCNSDAFLSEKGFLFPNPGQGPNKDAMLRAWINGTAGNPVFTDCIPPGDAD